MRRTTRPHPWMASLGIGLLMSLASPVRAQWLDGGTRICGSALEETPARCVAQPPGHLWVAWREFPAADTTHALLRVNRWNAAGQVEAGLPPCGFTLSSGQRAVPEFGLSSDGADGVYAAWIERGPGGSRLLCQHVDGSGATWPGWPGTALLLADTSVAPGSLRSFGDDQGGLYVIWRVPGVNPGNPAYATVRGIRILADGTVAPGWLAQGNVLRAQGAALYEFDVAPDGLGGLLIVWVDNYFYYNQPQAYLSRYEADGGLPPGWHSAGAAVSSPSYYPQDHAKITPDGTGGAYIVWSGQETYESPRRLFAMHRIATGGTAAGWPATGALVVPATFESPGLVPDGVGGAFLAGAVSANVVLQHMGAESPIAPGWPVTGFSLTFDAGAERPVGMVPDHEGGVLVAWQAAPCEACPGVLRVQRRIPNGTIALDWPASGVLVAPLADSTAFPSAVEDGVGGMLLSWSEPSRDPGAENRDSRVQRILLNALSGSTVDAPHGPLGGIALRSAPNPARGLVALEFELPGPSTVRLTIEDVAGRVVWSRSGSAPGGGLERWTWDGRTMRGAIAPPGFYLARIQSSWGEARARLVRF